MVTDDRCHSSRADMIRRMIQASAGRAIFAALMLLALVMRMAVPTGFMPTASGDGVIVSICTGDGPLTRVIDLGDKKHSKDPQQNSQGFCTFAASLGGGLASEPPALPLSLPFALAPMLGTAIADLTVHRLAAPPPPSQGPPMRG